MNAPAKRTAAERQEFLDEVDAQNTAAVREKAFKYARKRAELLARCGLPIERSLAGHLLADALGDTYIGDVDWRPERCDLYMHLRSVIRYRTKDMMARARKLPHERFGGGFDADSGDRVEAEASGQSHRENAETRAVNTRLASKIAAVLHSAAEAANKRPGNDARTRRVRRRCYQPGWGAPTTLAFRASSTILRVSESTR